MTWCLGKQRKGKQMKLKQMGMAIGAAAMLMVTGCATYPVTFSDKSIPMEQGKYTVVGDQVMGEAQQLFILGFGLGAPGSGQQRALKQALNQVPGSDGLVSMAVDVTHLNLFFAHILWTKVSGTPVRLIK